MITAGGGGGAWVLVCVTLVSVVGGQQQECQSISDVTGVVMDCSGMNLTSSPSPPDSAPPTWVYRLILDDNQITHLTPEYFDIYPNLLEVSVRGNLIRRVDYDDVFQPVNYKVTRLHLDGNLIEDISDVDNIGNIQELTLNNNLLTTLNLASLNEDDADSLVRLEVSGNGITAINYRSTSKLPSLTHLDVGNNKLSAVYVNMSAVMPRLEELVMRSNGIQIVGDHVLRYSSDISSVDLTANKDLSCSFIPSVPEGASVLYDYCIQEDGDVYYPPGVTTPEPTEPPRDCSQGNLDYYPPVSNRWITGGYHEVIQYVYDADECRDLCDQYGYYQVCGGYTWLANYNYCYVWKIKAALTSTVSYVTSAIRGVFNRYYLQSLSGYVRTVTSDRGSFFTCERECMLDNECGAYRWHVNGECTTYAHGAYLLSGRTQYNSGIKY